MNGSLQVNLGLTDNPGGSGSKSSGFTPYTAILPSVFLTGDTARLKVRLNYSPAAYIYADGGSQNRISQGLNGSALGIIIPDAVFVDARALVSDQARFGGLASTGTSTVNNQFLNKNNSVQSSTVSVTPYAQHRFGGWGTAKVGYSIARTVQSTQNNSFANNSGVAEINGVPVTAVSGLGVANNVTSQRERASFVTGENFGRVNNELVVQLSQYSGGGVYQGAYNNFVSNEVGYAITRTIALLAGAGYQRVHFNGNPPYNLNGPTWNVGTRLTPNPDSSITITYGRRDGGNQVQFFGNYSPTARTRFTGSYSTGITTNALEQQDVLQSTVVGPSGLLVDSITGAPVVASSGSGVNNAVSRVKRLSLGGFLLLDRDTFSLTYSNQNSTTLTSSITVFGAGVPPGTVTTSNSVSLGWQHDLNPTTTLTGVVSYGTSDNGAALGNAFASSQTTVALASTVSHSFTETLSGSLGYSFSNRSGGQGNRIPASLGGSTSQNLLYASLRKSF